MTYKYQHINVIIILINLYFLFEPSINMNKYFYEPKMLEKQIFSERSAHETVIYFYFSRNCDNFELMCPSLICITLVFRHEREIILRRIRLLTDTFFSLLSPLSAVISWPTVTRQGTCNSLVKLLTLMQIDVRRRHTRPTVRYPSACGWQGGKRPPSINWGYLT